MRTWTMKGLLLAGALLAGCGGAEVETGAPATSPEAPEQGQVSAMAPAYDENIHCLVRTSSIRCNSGLNMYSYWSDEVGYYINRNVCGSRGPIICPL